MKKISFKNLNIQGMDVLTREQLKDVFGGKTLFKCQCNGTGTWSGSYDSAAEIVDAIDTNCSGGGTCTAA